MWPEWSAWTWWGLTTVVVVPALIAPVIWNRKAGIIAAVGRTPTDFLPQIFATFIFAVVVSGIGTGLYFFAEWMSNRSTTVWVNPTLPAEDQRKIIAGCEMHAAEVIQGGAIKDMDRLEYKENCLIAEGFSKERVQEGGAE